MCKIKSLVVSKSMKWTFLSSISKRIKHLKTQFEFTLEISFSWDKVPHIVHSLSNDVMSNPKLGFVSSRMCMWLPFNQCGNFLSKSYEVFFISFASKFWVDSTTSKKSNKSSRVWIFGFQNSFCIEKVE